MGRETCSLVYLNNQQLPQCDDTKHLGMQNIFLRRGGHLKSGSR